MESLLVHHNYNSHLLDNSWGRRDCDRYSSYQRCGKGFWGYHLYFFGEKAPAVDEGASQVTFEALASGTSEHGCVWKQGPCGSS